MDKLKQCPFCGGKKVEPRTNDEGISWYMFCSVCGVSCGYALSKDDVIKAWNNRVPSSQPEPQWISCDECNPDHPNRVLVQLDNEWIIAAWYDDEEKKWYSVPPQYDDHDCRMSLEDIGYTVLAWREMPECWQEV